LQISYAPLQRKRAVWLFALSVFLLSLLVLRLAWLQFVRGPELRERALAVRLRDIPVEAKRGTIYDRTGRELAISIDVDSVYAIPSQVRDKTATSVLLADTLGLDKAFVMERLQSDQSFVWIKRKISSDQAAVLRAAGVAGVSLTQESKRVYPNNQLACHVLGFAGIDSQGLEGVEYQYDSVLRGVPGWISIEYDARGQEIPDAVHRYFAPTDGLSLVLTIDQTIQYICERELALAVANHGAKAGSILVMDPRNGEILAMANYPYYDPNQYGIYPSEFRRNGIVVDTYSPGSTFKPVVAAAALEEHVVSWNDTFLCEGSVLIGNRRIHCWETRGHEEQTLLQVLENSCNVGFMEIAARLGIAKFYQYVEAFGLTSRTGVDLPGEAKGLIIPENKAKPLDLAVMSFGQSLTVTPLQLVSALCAIANGGTLYQPHVAKELRTADGRVVERYSSEIETSVIAARTAAELNDALESVVEQGTGRRAFIDGYQLAGKTGTAQKIVDGAIAADQYVSSFIGFGPTRDAQVCALVILDEPTGDHYGGQIAGPVFRTIMQEIYRYLGIPVVTEGS